MEWNISHHDHHIGDEEVLVPLIGSYFLVFYHDDADVEDVEPHLEANTTIQIGLLLLSIFFELGTFGSFD